MTNKIFKTINVLKASNDKHITFALRIFCIHFGFKSFGLIKLLQFDNRDISTSFIFPFSVLEKISTFF